MNTTTQATTDYNAQAKAFLTQTGVTFNCEFLKHGKHFDNDKETRDIYKITLTRGKRSYSFNFGQSIMDSQYYKDSVHGRTYTLNGCCRTGNYSIIDIDKYLKGGQKLSLIKGVEPNEYDVLACLQKYDVGTFENFCSEFGYDTDSRTAEKTYKAVCDEYKQLCAIFSDDEIEQLQEIQ